MYEDISFPLVWHIHRIQKINEKQHWYKIQINARTRDAVETPLIETKKAHTLDQALLDAYSELKKYSDLIEESMREMSRADSN